jgi:hypothetical protein
MHPSGVGNVAKERFSYPLRPRLARSGARVLATDLASKTGENGGKIRQNQ